jgi:hypothetical protein
VYVYRTASETNEVSNQLAQRQRLTSDYTRGALNCTARTPGRGTSQSLSDWQIEAPCGPVKTGQTTKRTSSLAIDDNSRDVL